MAYGVSLEGLNSREGASLWTHNVPWWPNSTGDYPAWCGRFKAIEEPSYRDYELVLTREEALVLHREYRPTFPGWEERYKEVEKAITGPQATPFVKVFIEEWESGL